MRTTTVGISHRLKRAWLDDLLDRLVQTRDERELRAFIDKRLRDELPGKDARAKASGILLRIWSGAEPKHVGLRDRAVALLPLISGQERIWLHWGMAALAYPFFRDLAEVIGRILTLQDDITNAQVQTRLKTAWGDRETSKEAAGKLITSMVDWEVLRATKTKGHFLLARKMTTSVTDLQLWLLEAMLMASSSDEIEAHQLLRLPELFPFTFTVGVADLRKHEGFNFHRQGLDMDMVAIRQMKSEATSKSSRKGKKEAARQQPTFFDEPSLSAPNPTSTPSQQAVGFDLTFPKLPPTGQERSLTDLTQPDERSIAYGLDVETLQAPYLTIESRLPSTIPAKLRERITVARNLGVFGFFCYEFHAVSMFWSISCIEMALKLKFRELNPGPFRLARKKKDGGEETCEVAITLLDKRLRERWRILGMKDFDYSFRAFLAWAFRSGILPDDLPIPIQEIMNSFNNRFALEIFFDRATKEGLIGPNPTLGDIQRTWAGLSEKQRRHYQYKRSDVLIEELPRFRNDMAHPESWNLVTVPRSPLSAFELLIDVVARLWPQSA